MVIGTSGVVSNAKPHSVWPDTCSGSLACTSLFVFSDSAHMKNTPVVTAILTCLVFLTACTAPDYSDPDQVAKAYVSAVLARDGSHTALELTGLSPELQRYCNLGLTPDWRTNMPSNVKFVERLEKGIKGEGRAENLDDYMVGLSGKGPFTSSNLIAYLVELKFVDGDGKEHTAALALRPDHGDQPETKGKVFDWKDVEWKVVPR